jgi:hypothetical protein
MKRKLVIGLALASIALAVAATQDGVLIRRELKENSLDMYLVTMTGQQNVNVPGMGEQPMGIKSSMHYTLKTGKVDPEKGEADCEMIVTDMKFELDGPMAEMAQMGDMPKEIVVPGKLNNRNRVVVDSSKLLNPTLMMLGANTTSGFGFTIEFPEKPVKIGDAWEVTLPKTPFFGKAEPKLAAKLLGEKTYDKTQVWEISMEGEIPLDVDLQEVMKSLPAGSTGNFPDMKIMMRGTVKMTSTFLVEKSSGRVYRMESTAGGKQTLELVDMGMNVETSGSMTTVMALQKPVS